MDICGFNFEEFLRPTRVQFLRDNNCVISDMFVNWQNLNCMILETWCSIVDGFGTH